MNFKSLEEVWAKCVEVESSYLVEDLKERVEGLISYLDKKVLNIDWISTESDSATVNLISNLTIGKELEAWSSDEGEESYKAAWIESDYGTSLYVEMNIPGMTDYLIISLY